VIVMEVINSNGNLDTISDVFMGMQFIFILNGWMQSVVKMANISLRFNCATFFNAICVA